MLIDRIFQKVKTFVNTEVRGNVSPAEFNLLLHDAIQSRTEEYFYDLKRELYRENRGLGMHFLSNLPDRIMEKVMHYHKTDTLVFDTASTRELPEDLRYLDEIETSTGIGYEHCDTAKEFRITKSIALSQYPICYTSGRTIRISPDNSDTISISYVRNVLIPKWTYTVVNNAELFNPSSGDFVDADIHPSEEDEIVRRVLLRFGVNLKEQDIQAFAMQEDTKEFNQTNAT